MRPTTKLAVAAAALTLVCLAGLVVLASPAAPRARLLTTREMHTLMGGSCANLGCVSEDCDISTGQTPCPTTNTICKWSSTLNSCVMVSITSHAVCNTREGYHDCSTQLGMEHCGKYFSGKRWGGECPQHVCMYQYACGPLRYQCQDHACEDKD